MPNSKTVSAWRLRSTAGNRRRAAGPGSRRLLGLALLGAAAVGCFGPQARIPPRLAPAAVPGALAPGDSQARLAAALAPVLYLQRDESFQLERVVAAVHPERRVIAYYLLWADDVHGAWVPFTIPTDEEVVWVGYDSTLAPTEVWTYWHGRILHTAWPRRQVAIDVQWGKHGSLPRGVIESDLPGLQTLNVFYAATLLGVADILLSDLNRQGPLCFCHGYRRYREFTLPVPLYYRLDAVVATADPRPALSAVFGLVYSEKPLWPWNTGSGE